MVSCPVSKGLDEKKSTDTCISKIKRIRNFENLKAKPIIAINGFTADISTDQVKILKKEKNIVDSVEEDRKINLDSDSSKIITSLDVGYTWGLTKIKIPDVRTTYPTVTGTGVVVGIVDSGIYGSHQEFTDKIKSWKDFSPYASSTPADDCGHGTHVAGTISGGSLSGANIGVAPNVKIVVARALTLQWPYCSGSESGIILAMQWMANYDGLGSKVDVVNMSLGRSRIPGETPELATDAFHKAVTYLARKGIVVVISAGNNGPAVQTIGFPGSSPAALTVGAVDSTNTIASFSSKGPADWLRNGSAYSITKPEIVAPGVAIQSSYTGNPTAYVAMDGTSMAAPHVTGVVALIKQVKPGITVNNVIKTVQRFATPLPTSGNSDILASIFSV
jgi:serine protease AprX